MMRASITAGLLLVSSPALAQDPPPPSEIIEAMTLKIVGMQQNLDELYLGVAKLKAMNRVADEKAKWVLDNWVPMLDNRVPKEK